MVDSSIDDEVAPIAGVLVSIVVESGVAAAVSLSVPVKSVISLVALFDDLEGSAANSVGAVATEVDPFGTRSPLLSEVCAL